MGSIPITRSTIFCAGVAQWQSNSFVKSRPRVRLSPPAPMRISVKVKTKAKKEGVKKLAEGEFLVSANEAPEKGKANRRVVELLAEYFDVAKSNVEIVSGETSKRKIVEIICINNDNKNNP